MTSFKKKFILVFFGFYIICTFPCLSGEILYGKDIKRQASEFFETIGLEADVLISDRRAFFYCSSKLNFIPRINSDWRTIEARCETENWQSVMRTSSLPPGENILEKSYSGPTSKAVSLAKNMSKGQVIEIDDLILVEVPEQNNFESFTNLEKVVGRKITSNLARGTVLKARHVKYMMSVNKNDTVLIIVGNNKLSITTYGIALVSGQKGDMITVENQVSKKKFKALVIGEKKVTPLTNM